MEMQIRRESDLISIVRQPIQNIHPDLKPLVEVTEVNTLK